MKRTDWFSGEVKPVRRGIYERAYANEHTRAIAQDYWSGHEWFYSQRGTPCLHQNRAWRGLTSEGGK